MKHRPLILFVALGFALAAAGAARSQFFFDSGTRLVQLSHDPFTNGGGAEHATELEADTFAYGSTIVGTFQVGRFPDGGASAIGWAMSTNAGKSWKYGFLPSLTKQTNPPGPFDRASDPAVAYDAKHGVWLIATLPVTSGSSPAVVVSPSTDGGLKWGKPIGVAPAPSGFSDKNWIACDNTATSPYFGQCYVEWDNGQIAMNVSKDGGQTWGTTTFVSNAFGLGGQPLAQPNGHVVVPYSDGGGNIDAVVSTDGGQSWINELVSPENDHGVSQMRAPSLPSAQIDGAGDIFVVWHDCSFRAGCAENDIVMSASSDGMNWSVAARIPIDPTTSTVDHFTPGIAVDTKTAGAHAHLGVVYNYFPQANCSISTCRLYTGFISSHNGGATWGKPQKIAGPMLVTWLANAGGYFVGDYQAGAFTPDGLEHSVFAVAVPPKGGTLNEAAHTTATGLKVQLAGPEFSSRFDRRYPNAHSDHPRRRYPPKKRTSKKAFESD